MFSGKARARPQVSTVHERNTAVFLLISNQVTHVSTNGYRLNRQTGPGIQSVPPADLIIGMPPGKGQEQQTLLPSTLILRVAV